jgi:hypothetical protein
LAFLLTVCAHQLVGRLWRLALWLELKEER